MSKYRKSISLLILGVGVLGPAAACTAPPQSMIPPVACTASQVGAERVETCQ